MLIFATSPELPSSKLFPTHPPSIDIYTKSVSFRAHAQPLRKHTSDSETHQIAYAVNIYLIYNVCMIVVLPCVIGKHTRSIHNYTAVAVTRGRLRKRTQLTKCGQPNFHTIFFFVLHNSAQISRVSGSHRLCSVELNNLI